MPTERVTGIFPVSDDATLWVTDTTDMVVTTAEIELTHPDVLAGRTIKFGASGLSSAPDLGAAVSTDGSVAAIPVRVSDGSGGIALVRSDGYKMALHLYGGPDVSIASIKFMTEFGLTLLSLSDDSGSRVIAINNYGLQQFELPITDSFGTVRYSPKELEYLVIDRRPLESELELVPFAEPGDSTLFRASEPGSESDELFRSLASAIVDWR